MPLLLALPLAPVVVELLVDHLALEHLVVPGELGEQDGVGAALALDRRVAVDGEGLHAGGALGLQHRRQQVEREVDHVGGVGGGEGPVEVDQVGHAERARRVAAQQAEQAQGVEVDALHRGEDLQPVVDQEAHERQQRRAVEVGEVARDVGAGAAVVPRTCAAAVGGDVLVDGRVERQRLGAHALAAVGEAVIGLAQDAPEEHRDHLVAQPPRGRLLHHLRVGDALQQSAVAGEQRARLGRQGQRLEQRARRDGEGAGRRGEQQPHVVHGEQGERQPQAQRPVVPGGGAQRDHGARRLNVSDGQRAELPSQPAVAPAALTAFDTSSGHGSRLSPWSISRRRPARCGGGSSA